MGRIVVDSKGRTLYAFARDKNGRSACSGTCATYWPPLLTSGKVRAGHGAKASLLGSAGYSIYDGWTLKGKVVHTLVRGELVFENGALVEAAVGYGRYLHRQLPACASHAGAMKQNSAVGSRFDTKEIK